MFLEDQFPGVPDTDYVTPPVFQPDVAVDDWLSPNSDITPITSPLPIISPPDTTTTSIPAVVTSSENTTAPETDTLPDKETTPLSPVSSTEHSAPPHAINPPSPGIPELLGRGHRTSKPSVLLKDYVVNALQTSTPPIVSLVTPTPLQGSYTTVLGTPYPIENYLSKARFSSGHMSFLAALTSSSDPKNYKEASIDDIWNDSMTDEYTTLEANHTWDITTLPPGKKAIICQWIYKTKLDANGKETRKKSRLVACGNRQREGLDYTDTFALVAKPTSVRILLQVAAVKKWEIHQMDVHNAFLHGDLKEDVYMKLPPGFDDPDPTKVCRLRKSIYGLKQSPWCWFFKLTAALKSYGFKQSRADYSHFSLIKGTVCLHILIYVDDFIITSNDNSTLQRFKNYLHKCFHMKDLGKLKYFLGIEVARNDEGIFLFANTP